jgi:hypothetical protein
MRLAIGVKPNLKQDSMDPMARLHYGRLYTIEHNVKVYDFGCVRPEYILLLLSQWRDVMGWQFPGSAGSNSTAQGSASNTIYEGSSNTMGAYRGSSQNYHDPSALAPVPETAAREPPPHFIDYAVVKTTYKPTSNDRTINQHIPIKREQRLGIIQMYESGWRKAWNQTTEEIGMVWKDYILLDSEP